MRLLITDSIAKNAIEMLKENFDVELKIGLSEEELISIIPSYEIIIVRSSVRLTDRVISAGKSLKIIARPGVGVDNIDTKSATKNSIVVINTPLGNINAAAELTIGMILSLARSVHNANFSLRIQKQWERKKFLGIELRDKTLGIIGFGHVGRIVARIARKGLLMNVITYDTTDKRFEAEELDVRLVSLDEIFVNSDFISLHVPLIEQTKNMIAEREFDKMKNGVFIINAARGGIINESVLYNALKTGKVSGAGIDVWEKEPCIDNKLLELENVLALPHIGASTTEAQENVAIDIAKQIILAVENGKVENSVNGVLVLR